MKTFAVGSLAALLVVAATAPSYAQTAPRPAPPPSSGSRDGENAYKLGCAIMWMLGYSVCQELPGAPKPRQQSASDAAEG